MRALPCLLLSLAALTALAGCDRSSSDRNCYRLASSSIAPPAGPVPETLAVSGATMVLRADLVRDFMPPSPPQGEPMLAVVQLVATDSLAIPEGVVPDHLWALQPPRTWSTPLEVVARGRVWVWARASCGPLWDPGTFATVLVRVRTPEGDRFVRRDSVEITRTD